MAANKRTAAQRLEDYGLIASLARRGKTQKQIAAELSKGRKYKLTQQQISEDMAKLQDVWKESAAVDIDSEKGKLKAMLEDLIAIAYDAWDRSKTDAVKEVEGYSKTQGNYHHTTTEHQVGDPRFLSELRALSDQYAKLFGLTAPENLNVTMNKPVEIIEVNKPAPDPE